MKKVLYIHGFASTGNTSKVDQLRSLPDIEVIAPTLTHNPAEDICYLMDIVRKEKVTTVVGSSLGGFYALYLAQRFDLGLVLINPALYPYDTLKAMLGEVPVYGTDVSFSWTEEKLEQLKELGKTVTRAIGDLSSLHWARTLVLLAEKDELLDSAHTANVLNKASIVLDSKEDHRFQSIVPYLDNIQFVITTVSLFDSEPNPKYLPSDKDIDAFLAKKAPI